MSFLSPNFYFLNKYAEPCADHNKKMLNNISIYHYRLYMPKQSSFFIVIFTIFLGFQNRSHELKLLLRFNLVFLINYILLPKLPKLQILYDCRGDTRFINIRASILCQL